METGWPILGPESTVKEAIRLFVEARISGVPVVEDGRLIGIITEGDLILQDADIKAPGFLDILGGMVPLGSTDEYRREALQSAGVTRMDILALHVLNPRL